MKKVKTFFYVLKNSIFPQSSYYHKLKKTPFVFSLKYFFALMLFLNFVFLFLILLQINLQALLSFKNSLINNLNEFPNDLTISINRGSLITTLNRPYFLWLDNFGKKNLFLVIDESATPDRIKEYGANFMLTKKYLVINKKYFFSSTPLSNINFSININRQMILWSLDLIKKYWFKLLITFFVFSFFLFLFISFLVGFFYLILASLIVYLTFLLISIKLPFKKIFQLSLHSSSLPLLINYFFGWLILFPGLLKFQLIKVNLSHSFLILVIIFLLGSVYTTFFEKRHAKIRK
ncbi:MAG: DUF1189 family protein [Microgenomates group bacterium]|nr:DUF1189 family protein [Microgenomates group bacterium]